MSLYCPRCAKLIMELNPSTRQFVSCPCCEVMIERIEQGCDLVECYNCQNQFCYGCNFIFVYGAEVDWVCTCLIRGTHPREYKDPSFSSCKIKFKNQIKVRLGRMLDRVLHNMSDMSDIRDMRDMHDIHNTSHAITFITSRISDINEVLEQLRIAEEIGDNDDALVNRIAILN